jgi:hypothetical protein
MFARWKVISYMYDRMQLMFESFERLKLTGNLFCAVIFSIFRTHSSRALKDANYDREKADDDSFAPTES